MIQNRVTLWLATEGLLPLVAICLMLRFPIMMRTINDDNDEDEDDDIRG